MSNNFKQLVRYLPKAGLAKLYGWHLKKTIVDGIYFFDAPKDFHCKFWGARYNKIKIGSINIMVPHWFYDNHVIMYGDYKDRFS